jgi:DNA-binding FadR family transcriptional regulator
MKLSDSLTGGLSFSPVPVNRRSMVDQVATQLREAILSGSLAVGSTLPSEAKLAASLSVSRPVVREALGSLRALGLVQSKVGRGWEVVGDSINGGLWLADSYLSEHLYEVRQHLEVPSAGYAALRRTDEEIEALRSILDAERRATSATAAVDLDAQFHTGVARCSRNPLFVRMIEFIRAGLEEQSLALSTVSGRSARAVNEHFAVLEAIQAGDRNAAEEAMRAHLTAVSCALLELGRVRPRGSAYFTDHGDAQAAVTAEPGLSAAPARADNGDRRLSESTSQAARPRGTDISAGSGD